MSLTVVKVDTVRSFRKVWQYASIIPVEFGIQKDDDEMIISMDQIMPLEAKIGLLLGIALTIVLAIFLKPAESAATQAPMMTKVSNAVQGQVTSIHK